MHVLERFAAYAADFEQTLADDDWSRLDGYFHDDAVYEVDSQLFGCTLTGPEAIFVGMKKSLDGFDRLFSSRDVEMTDGPHVEGDEMRVAWKITYHKAGLPDFVLEGRSIVGYRGDRIARLVDAYDEESVGASVAEWTGKTGVQIDPSYT